LNTPDTLQRFVFEQAPVRGEIVHLDATWRAVLDRHDYPPVLRDMLGELMAAAALLSATLKFSGSLIMQMQGTGPVKLLVVECNSDMTLRATATWEGELISPRLADLLGGGRFAITIDPQQGGQSYQGIVDLEGDSVAEVLQNYMTRSEQLDTRLWLAADAGHAAGMLLQRLPSNAHDDDEAWNRAQILGGTVTRGELLALPAVEVVRRLYHEEDVRLFESSPVSFRCSCSRERVTDMLRMLGYDEVKSVVAEQGSVEVDCEFCNRHFGFDAVDVEQIFAAEVVTPASSARH
jgi:molecular chaperone Hsp33